MKAVFDSKQISQAVSAVSPFTPARTSKDILKNIKLAVSGDQATISATDSENSIIYYLRGVEVQHAGCVLLPASKLRSILGEAPVGERMVIEVINGIAHISYSRSKFKIPTEDASGFPDVREFDESSFVTIKAQSLRRMLLRTVFCCDKISTRYALSLSLIHI